MKLQRIISLANKKNEIRFLAMVRSLRETGCNLPVWVIPYDKHTFELPDNCVWWELPEIIHWIDNNKLWPAFKKIQCLTIENYQFVDSDVIFLRDPGIVLKGLDGFITSCTHWSYPDETFTPETLLFLKTKSTTWPKLVFNSGQWACDRQLFEVQELISFCEHHFVDTLFKNNYLYKDQPGINILVNYKHVPITNITLPPVNMESTWAGHYDDNYQRHWSDESKKPYLIHWAGCSMNTQRPIDELYIKYLHSDEKEIWYTQLLENNRKQNTIYNKAYRNLIYLKQVIKSIKFS